MKAEFSVREITRFADRRGLHVRVTLGTAVGGSPGWVKEDPAGTITLDLRRQEDIGGFDIGDKYVVTFETADDDE